MSWAWAESCELSGRPMWTIPTASYLMCYIRLQQKPENFDG